MEAPDTEHPTQAPGERGRWRSGGLGRLPSFRRPGRRTLVVLLAVLVVFEALYLVAANVFLSTELSHRAINHRPEKLLVSYQSAWSPWPGEVRVKGLRIRGQGRRLQWTATADRISGRIGLVPLLWKSFRASDVDGEKVIFRLRRREDRPLPKQEAAGEPAPEPPPEAEAAEPPIPGLENPPEPAPEEIYPPLDPDRRRWTVILSDFDLREVSEIWIDRARVRGDMALVDGGMTMKLKRSLDVHPSRFRLDGAHVHFDGREVADEVTGEVLLSSAPFDHTENRGLDAIPFLLARADLTARLAGLGWLNRYLGAGTGIGTGLRIEGGSGTLDVDATLRKARFAPGSRLTLGAPRFAVRFLDYAARGAGRLVWTVDEEHARLAATFDGYRLGRDGYDDAHVEGEGLTMTLSGLGDDLPPSLGEASVAIEIPPARVPDLTFYNAYLPPAAGLTIRSGEATVRGSFVAQPSAGTGSGRISLASDRVRADFRATPLVGALAIEGELPSADLEARSFRLDGTRVTVRDARRLGAADRADGKPWTGRITVKSGTLAPGGSPLLRARAVGAITDVRPVLSLFSAGAKLPDWVLDALGIDDVQARAAIEVGDDRVTLDDLAARADDLTLDGEVRLRGGRGRDGRLLIGYKGLHLGLDLHDDRTDLKLLRARRWYESGR